MPSPHLSQALEVYTQGTQAWFTDDKEGWVSASLVSKDITGDNVKMTFRNDDDESREHVFEAKIADLEKNNAESLPPLRNPPKMESSEDLTDLSYLNEPSVLNTIRTRYQQRIIYTYSGIVLIAANPFDRVALYEPEIIQKYSGKRRGELEPHLFAIAEDAYRCMIRESSNQTIIVSGESGAGKTVSAKFIMRYFATADDKETTGKKAKSGAMTEVEEQILATNPIMEAFGNAKTTRNDNSSRFGKYIEIQFDKHCNIVGAKIRTYLLERSRLIFQPETERNYHIFYQLCAGASDEERKQLALKPWQEYHYMNQSGTGEINGVDDKAEFQLTQQSLATVGISTETQKQIFQLLAALLHLGNIEIGGRTDAMLSDDDDALNMATQLLGINKNEFRKWIVRKQIITRSEKIMTNLNPTQAQVVRDSIAKYIYSNLFDWLVSVVNESLSCNDLERVKTFIGVLDIYGFEHFKKNSFEQFCINYANEKLQQQFNQHVFKLEQEEYVRENIDWTFIEFSDNQKCIELIEAKMGILSLLDEESRLPSGSDQGFCNKLYNNFGTTHQDYFKKPRFSNNAFTVVHYAHDVQYEAEGFMDKNKDSVPDEHLALLQNAESPFLKEMLQRASEMASANSGPAATDVQKKGSVAKKPTLGSMFKLSLINLMDTIGQTNVHYIRCIKPNEAKTAWAFEPNMVLAQLRACGVLETIRISCAGYPSRWLFEEFAERYYALVGPEHWYPKNEKDIRTLCTAIVDEHIKDTNKYQVGLTKIFFRAGQLAFLEKLRTDRWSKVAVFLQKNVRRFLARRRYLRIMQTILRVQQVARRIVGQHNLERLRQERAATSIQKYWRGYLARQAYKRQRERIIKIQAAIRGFVARKHFSMIREHNAATQIQRIARGWAARKRYQKTRLHIIRIQTCIRRRNAHKQLVVMRAEARSVSHFKEVSYKLETRVTELTQTLTQQKEEKAKLRSKATELESQVRAWIAKYENLGDQAKGLEVTIGHKDPADAERLASERDSLQNEYLVSLNKIKQQDKEIARLTETLSTQKKQISDLKGVSRDIVGKATSDTAVNMADLKSQIAALKSQLSGTLSQPRRLRQQQQQQQQQQHQPQSPKNGLGRRRRARNSMISVLTKDDLASVEPELAELLQDESLLQEGVLEAMIKQASVEHGDAMLKPAHAVGKCVLQLWRRGCLSASERWLLAVSETIERQCMAFTGENANAPCAFWLANAHELASVLCAVTDNTDSVEKLVTLAKNELQSVQETVYNHWMTETKRQLQRVVVAGVIESQALPGFVVTNNSSVGQNSSVAVEDVVRILDSVRGTVKDYSLDDYVSNQMLDELVKFIGVVAFNDLIGRRNFNSWKRAMQIQHNVQRLEAWCEEQGLGDATLQLEPLIQAIKLLQLKKSSMEDIKIIYDVCWVLTPVQVQKLIQSYSAADYEDPVSHDVMRSIASRATAEGKKDGVLLPAVPVDESTYEMPALRTDAELPTSVDVSEKLQPLMKLLEAK